jgi:hypothetical protein
MNLNIKEIVRPATRVDLTHAVKFNDKYYCFFDERGLFSFQDEIKHFFIISQNGTILNEIKVPEELFHCSYFDLFIRKNNLFLKEYYDHKSFCFDTNKLEWKKIKVVNDKIYEDENYIITFLDFGEWGCTTWFTDKKTKKEYELGTNSTFVNRLNGFYYLTDGQGVIEIDDPRRLKPCKINYYYEIIKKKKFFHQGSISYEGSKVIYADSTYDPWSFEEPKRWVITSFVFDNQLFQLCVDSNTTYVARIENKELVPIQNIGKKYSTFNWHYSYRGENLANNQRFLKIREDNNTFGFIEINDNKIDIHYLIHNLDSLKYLGSDGFEKLLGFVSKNIDDLTMMKVDSLEIKLNGTDLRTDKKGNFHNSYYPNKSNYLIAGTKEYAKVEDEIIAQTTEYFFIAQNSRVKAIFLEWSETNPYKEGNPFKTSFFKDPKFANRFKQKFEEIKRIVTQQLGKILTEARPRNGQIELTWKSDNGVIVTLYSPTTFDDYRQIRMIIYKE